MSIIYQNLPARVVPSQMAPSSAACDCCGVEAWYPAHRRPVATLGRVEDGDKGNMDYWELDLCTGCKNAVMEVLRNRALIFGRELPNTRSEDFSGRSLP